MNKKYLMFGILGVFSIMLVSAALVTYYGQVNQEINIESPIQVDSSPEEMDYIGGQDTVYEGEIITITNIADFDVDVVISNNAEDGIEVSYQGELELTKKDTSTWEAIEDKVIISYTVIGNEFQYSGVPEDYTLIYYKDAVVGLEGRLDNPQPAIEITDSIGSLPQEDDANLDADYSEAPDYYEHKVGAKIWAVPNGALEENTLDWSQMSEFYYETDLVKYVEGETGTITIGSESQLMPVYNIASNYQGSSIVTTSINVA